MNPLSSNFSVYQPEERIPANHSLRSLRGLVQGILNGMDQQFDAVFAMYHDQGLIPFKTIAQGEGVNYTAGLPVIRTSPDHGTAFDIAGQNIADPSSFRQAVFEAIDLLHKRRDYALYTANPMRRGNIEKEKENSAE